MAYPGFVVRAGSSQPAIVRAIQSRLAALGCGPVEVDGAYGPETERSVRLFQGRSVDSTGHRLDVDGQVGPATWQALFGEAPPRLSARTRRTPVLAAKAIEIAASQIGVMEQPLGSNRGPQVDLYLKSVNIKPATGSYAWCAAFIYWCHAQAAEQLTKDGTPTVNPVGQTAGVLDMWNMAGDARWTRYSARQVRESPEIAKPGHVFFLDFGGGAGHMGIVQAVSGIVLTTIEGNTNGGGSREGIGVFRRTSRRTNDHTLLGLVDYSSKF